MRWLVIHPGPHFSVHDVYAGWVEALRALGEEVLEYNLGDRLTAYDAALVETGNADGAGHPEVRKLFTREQALNLAADRIFGDCMKWWPHVVLGVSAFFIPAWYLDVLRDRGMKTVLLHTESPYQDDEQLKRAEHADLNLLNDPVNIGAYRQFGPAEYMPHAYRPRVHRPGPAVAELKSDFAFVGTGFASRVEFFERMDFSGLDVLLAGAWPHLAETSPLRRYLTGGDVVQCTGNEETAAIYRSTRAGINFYRREAEDAHQGEGWAVGPREVEMAACGTFFLRDPRGEGDDLFPMLPAFDGPADASEKLRWWLAHDSQREDAAAAARAAVADRTFEANARRLLQLLDK
ncbi:MAG TPA: glycosyltransferase [Trebonia sp.]